MTPEGEEHSRALGDHLKHKVWTKVYSSDLKRALSSSHNILSKSLTGNYIEQLVETDLLREVHFGVRENLPRGTSVLQALEIKAAQANIPVDDVIDTSETPAQVLARQRALIDFLYEDMADGSCASAGEDDHTAICISHGGFIRKFLSNYCDCHVEKIGNCSVSVVTITWTDKGEFQCSAKPEEVNVSWEVSAVP